MQNERWLPVPNYEGHYEVSDMGNVRSLKSGKVLRTSLVGSGYPRVNLCAGGRAKDFLVHRLVMKAFAGECPDGMNVNHLDGDKTNNKLSNLEYTTYSNNILHALRGDKKFGTRKLTEHQIYQIRSLLKAGVKQTAISEDFGISQAQISFIRNGHCWSHLTSPESAS